MTPKARLLEDKDTVKFVRQIVVDPRFVAAADATLLESVRALPDTCNQVDAVAHFNRIIGARDLLARLATIADQPTVSTPTQTTKLNYHA